MDSTTAAVCFSRHFHRPPINRLLLVRLLLTQPVLDHPARAASPARPAGLSDAAADSDLSSTRCGVVLGPSARIPNRPRKPESGCESADRASSRSWVSEKASSCYTAVAEWLRRAASPRPLSSFPTPANTPLFVAAQPVSRGADTSLTSTRLPPTVARIGNLPWLLTLLREGA